MAPNPPTHPTSMRFSPEELALIEAIAAHQLAEHGLKMSVTDVVRAALRSYKAPESLGATAANWRVAYKKVFGG